MSRSNVLRICLWFCFFAGLIIWIELYAVPRLAGALPPKNAQYGRMQFIGDVVRSPESFDILFLGDSTAKRGIIPSLFHERTGFTGFNLASYGTLSPFIDPSLLEKYTEHHRPPRAVVVVNTINAGSRPLDREAILDYFSDSLPLIFALAKNNHWPISTLVQAASAKILPSVSLHRQIRRSLTPYLFGTYEDVTPVKYVNETNGWDGDLIVGWPEEYEPENEKWDFSPESEFGVLLGHLCERAERLGTKVYFTFGPMSELFTSPERRERVEKKMKSVSAFVASHPGCFYLDGARVYENRFLSNDTHVNETGAILFTQQLSQELQPFLE